RHFTVEFSCPTGRLLLWRITSACWRGQHSRERNVDSALSAAFSPRWLLLRQNLFDQLEYPRPVLLLPSGQIQIFLAFFRAVVGIDAVFWNIDAAGIVRVGPAELLQRDLPFPGQQPVNENFCRVGVGRARRDAERAAGGTAAAALLPVFGVEVTDRQLVLHCLAYFAARVAANTQREFACGKPVGHLPRITAYGDLHVAIEFFEKWRAEGRMIVKKLQRRSHAEFRRGERNHFSFPLMLQ